MAGAYRRGEFKRPTGSAAWTPSDEARSAGAQGGAAWQSNGGAYRLSPLRALPFSLHVDVPEEASRPKQVVLYGVFAASARPTDEPSGAIGAILTLQHDGRVVQRFNLIQGRHYNDATAMPPVYRPCGDGGLVETVGQTEIDGVPHRVDRLLFSIPPQVKVETLTFSDLGTPASFLIFEVGFQFEEAKGCPFRGEGGQVALSELGSILRLRDRPRYAKALDQLEAALIESDDLEESRGQALTFLAALCAARLELGEDRAMHRYILQAARTLDSLTESGEIARQTIHLCAGLAADIFGDSRLHTDSLIHRALRYLERHFAEPLTDADLADRIGLSTSHFRHLFRDVTKQPFHRYLLSLRLEKAREMVLQSEASITEVSERCGFASPAHFSRAFTQRFGVSPRSLRDGRDVGPAPLD
ncbi:MAG: AraC family transcriptional regulator [Fimbriimonadaceae bacterium]|nr:AraC family transcriptional regulator [Fimbriimonadaceae bacterium]